MFKFRKNVNIFQTLYFNSRDELFNEKVLNNSNFKILRSVKRLLNIRFRRMKILVYFLVEANPQQENNFVFLSPFRSLPFL